MCSYIYKNLKTKNMKKLLILPLVAIMMVACGDKEASNEEFCDCLNKANSEEDAKECCGDLDMGDCEEKYSKDCVALICVHMGGHPCEMEKILPWAKKKKIIGN